MPSILNHNNLADLLEPVDEATIYNAMLWIAQTLGLPVSTWSAGDPTRSLLFITSQLLAKRDSMVVGFIQSGFLDYAEDEWLAVLAKQLFDVDVPGATFAETAVVLTNASGGIFEIGPGDLTFKNADTGATYHNTTGGTLAGAGTTTTPTSPGDTLTVDVIADLAGSGGSADATRIDTLVTTLLGVSCSNADAAVGVDEPDDEAIRQLCRDKAASLSPNGPAEAYSYVALTPALTGIQTVTRARVYPDSETGDVQVYVAGPGGAISGGDVTAVQAAIDRNATPQCFTATVAAANPVSVAVTYTLWLYQTPGGPSQADVEAAVSAALGAFFAARPIGGDIIPPATTGALYKGAIESVIGRAYPGQTFRVSLTSPAGDTALGNGDVAVLGTVTPTVNLIPGP
jgi:phage-related baseplate assembly protein